MNRHIVGGDQQIRNFVTDGTRHICDIGAEFEQLGDIFMEAGNFAAAERAFTFAWALTRQCNADTAAQIAALDNKSCAALKARYAAHSSPARVSLKTEEQPHPHRAFFAVLALLGHLATQIIKGLWNEDA